MVASAMGTVERATVRISNIPSTAIANELFNFFESKLGKGSVFACDIFTERKNWKSRGFGRVQFETIEAITTVNLLSQQRKLVFQNSHLSVSSSFEDIIIRPIHPRNRFGEGGVLHVGFLAERYCLNVLESWKVFKAEIMPERKRVDFWVGYGGETYRLEIGFGDVFETSGCCLGGKESNALLLKLKHAPKIYQKVSGPTIASKFGADRYHICKENHEFLWVRTTDFSVVKSIGHSSAFCWEPGEVPLALNIIITSFPYCEGHLVYLKLDQQELLGTISQVGPLITCPSVPKLKYEILFQLNALVHSHKISLASVSTDLIEILSNLSIDRASMILQKLQKEKSTCYDPMSFVQNQLHMNEKQLASCQRKLKDQGLMSCHRVLITPSKVYCLGPEVETSNYVVQHYAEYESDFLRMTFVEEDWTKLPSHAVSTSIEQGSVWEPYRTKIYHRILSILKNGIDIGCKKFKFLAFSASQLRSNSVWMFASNDKVQAEGIRKWMGCFEIIPSVSKCAARMGQQFSSSRQTFIVPTHEVATIPDVECTNDGINYCFSDGIGKISLKFAKQVAQKCGLSHTPSAFQIRYGGYKGVVAVDRNSFQKLSLRPSMQKFESKNRMLNVTNYSEYLPCYLNREIVSLLSTLGIEDEKFEVLQLEQIHLLDEMLSNTQAALDVVQRMGGVNSILEKMLLQGYEPSKEPYLFMLFKAYREYELSDIRTRCRIFVPRGRVLLGCLDETGTLSYGQVYIRVTMTKAERQCGGRTFFQKIDETTCIVTGKVVVTKNPCLHPGDIRVLEAVYEPALEEKGLVDCLVFPQKGKRPHPNECSGGDLDGDLFFTCWDENLTPKHTDTPLDYLARRPRIMDHEVTLEELQKFFVDYLINDNLGVISTAHLIHADREREKARSPKCLKLANLHSMAVDFAKTGAPAEMPRILKPKEYPDFMERDDRALYPSPGIIGKLYRNTMCPTKSATPDFVWSEELPGDAYDSDVEVSETADFIWSEEVARDAYDNDLEVNGFKAFLEIAESNKALYIDKMEFLMNYYGAESEEEILTGNLRNKSTYLQYDKRKYKEAKDRVMVSIKNLQKEVKEWFQDSCNENEYTQMASAWYHVTYHPNYCRNGINFLSFPWIVGDILLDIKADKSRQN